MKLNVFNSNIGIVRWNQHMVFVFLVCHMIWEKPADVLLRWIWAGWPSWRWLGLRDDTPETLEMSSPEHTASNIAGTASSGSPGRTVWETRWVHISLQRLDIELWVKTGGCRLESEGKNEAGRSSKQQNRGKFWTETCDAVIEQSDGGKKRKLCFFSLWAASGHSH